MSLMTSSGITSAVALFCYYKILLIIFKWDIKITEKSLMIRPTMYILTVNFKQGDGYEIDEKVANGPVYDRPCTDVLCLLLFLLFVAGFVTVAVFGF